ncbi:hypothetical protein [Microvirga sp. TS319]|uniref:hypothetical protein n=1 Tax=Microvirga sp. TS319 TaxID=3241165 RepID=UPI003519FF46
MEHEVRHRLKARAASSSEGWRKAAQRFAKAAVRVQDGAAQGACSLLIVAGRPNHRRRDIDDPVEPLSDAVVHGGAIADAIADDSVRVAITPAGARA